MMESGSDKDTVTQVSFGGFDRNVTAKEFTTFLEDEIGLVWRCRLKRSWTPPESYPSFDIMDTSSISITDDYTKVEPHAFVHFAMPASADLAQSHLFFRGNPLKVIDLPENPVRINKRRTTTPSKFHDVIVEIGVLVSQDDFFAGWRGPPKGVDFLVDPFDGTCKFLFTRDTAFSLKDTASFAVIKCVYKVEFLARDINEIRQYKDSSSLILLLQLGSSPLISYRTADDDIEELVPWDLLDDDDPWVRTTDFTPGGAIGRCNSYKISILPRYGLKLEKSLVYFRERRIPISKPKHRLRIHSESNFGIYMKNPFFCINDREGISFEILFMLNAVLHKGILNQHHLAEPFYNLLRKQSRDVNIAALKHIFLYKRPVFDAYKRLNHVQNWLLANPKLFVKPKPFDDTVEVRRLAITPTKAYCLPPAVELSNRVLRNYRDVSDRFLRVTFMEEGMQSINANAFKYFVAPIVKGIMSNTPPQKTKLFQRVKTILTDGFDLCDRKYSFLAFSTNQLKDCSAWFFADDRSIEVNDIKRWMGKFTNRNVAKCAARIGQCFSSTYPTVNVPINKVEFNFPDVKRNKYIFSDGIGIMMPDLAMEVAKRLKLETNPPSAYQIRYAGCKGVVACWPRIKTTNTSNALMFLRPSMNKFQSDHSVLEVCSWTRFQPGFLNRQIVTLLSTLKVKDKIFWDMQNVMVSMLERMLDDTDVAFNVLMVSCVDQGHTAAVMLAAGFKPQTEPHLRGMLSSVRASQFCDLRDKARIFVPNGRWLMGCLDELELLEHGQCFVQVSTPALENVFSKHGSRFSETKENRKVIEGLVVVAKNPCLHPGDVRILEAVDVPDLYHMYDCLVFPQKGDRPHTDEASGSDLDGDLYFVTWDQNLIPPSKQSSIPMGYDPAEAPILQRNIVQKDFIEFFTRSMVNDNLGTICNAHVVHADLSEFGASDDKCLELAKLAAIAVDFPKTGKIVNMPQELKPTKYPDFMDKPDFRSYNSDKILGKLYRHIRESYREDTDSPFSDNDLEIPYDKDLEIPGSSVFLSDALGHKASYDEQLNNLMVQYKVRREEEVVTGHVYSMPRSNSRKQGDLKERLKHAYTSLRKEFRMIFEKMESGDDSDVDDDEDEKNKRYEEKASAWYQVAYHPDWVKKSMEVQGTADGAGEVLLLSFPWIAADFLARIKIRCRGGDIPDPSSGAINELTHYISDRL